QTESYSGPSIARTRKSMFKTLIRHGIRIPSCYDRRDTQARCRAGAQLTDRALTLEEPCMTKRSLPLADLPGTDVLADVMNTLQVGGRVLWRWTGAGEWAFSMPVDGFARFHVIERGACWAGTPDGARRQLAAGDLLVAFGEHHMSDRSHPATIVPIAEF